MKLRTLVPALLTAVLATATAPPAAPPAPGPSWFRGSLRRARAEAARRGTLVFVDFSPDW